MLKHEQPDAEFQEQTFRIVGFEEPFVPCVFYCVNQHRQLSADRREGFERVDVPVSLPEALNRLDLAVFGLLDELLALSVDLSLLLFRCCRIEQHI